VAFRGHVLAHGRDRLAGNDPAPDGRLQGDLEEVPVDLPLELLHELSTAALGLRPVDNDRQSVYSVTVYEDIESHQVRLAEANHLVVHRPVTVRDALELVV